VFIVQEPQKRDEVSGQMVSMFDFRKVLEYGDPVVCLTGGRVGLSPGPTTQILSDKLRNFSDNDYLVPTGDPSAIAIAGAIASRNNSGRMKILKWDKESRRYILVNVNLYPGREA
jgi:hypothetical protein